MGLVYTKKIWHVPGAFCLAITLFAFLRKHQALIVDIRTEPEWRETGVVPGSMLLAFFKPDRSYDLDSFIAEVLQFAGPDKEIAILCRSGNRSAKVAGLLSARGFSSVVNVTGGIRTAGENKVELIPYQDTELPALGNQRSGQSH
jgi:rhodanese-related sulfurtransferase